MDILPQVQEALTFIKSVDVSHIKDPMQARRTFYDRLAPLAGAEEAVFSIENRANTRIYRPSNQAVLPAVVYFHGGGFNSGSLASHDRPLRQLANLSGVIIVSVDYRLAPEYPFPHGLNDCIDATKWVIENAALLGIDPHRVAVAGDSAGATLATAVAGSVAGVVCQILVNPATDPALTTPSWQEFANGPIITRERLRKIWADYAGGNTQAAPVYYEHLSRMPDAFIIIAEYDPLRDEGIAYAKKLREAHVQVTEKVYPKMIHGFFQMGGVIPEGRQVIADVAGYIRYKLIN
ncbi:alpha/beta hydrolase [Chitinophaga sp.]|uniref:alpha/beta hydrolase n=1 Tax=Chitinophaga sp. TaxID=1869181 RepID=UPI0031D126E1